MKDRQRAKALAWIGLLQDHGVNLHRPFADTLKGGIHELRMKITGDQLRILYFFCFQNKIVLTHCFNKTTDKVPAKEIRLAQKYREDFLKRHDKRK